MPFPASPRTTVATAAALFALAIQPALAQQRPAAFVDAATAAPGLVLEMRYATPHNFVGVPIDGYDKPVCYLTRQAATALADVARDLAPRGLALKVYDCYRPVRAVAHFVRWARNLSDQSQKAEFYPQVDKSTLFRDGYIASHSGHSRGSTVDITQVHSNGQAVDMGTPFDFFSTRTWPSDKTVSRVAQANRATLAGAMKRRNFRPYDKEWWHFTLRGEPFPHTAFNFPIR